MFEVVALIIVYAIGLAIVVCTVLGATMLAYEIKDQLRRRRRGGLVEFTPSDSIDHLDWTVR